MRAYAVQRHSFGQRSFEITDTRMDFTLETSQLRGAIPVKAQLEWVTAFAESLCRKRSNRSASRRRAVPAASIETDGRNGRLGRQGSLVSVTGGPAGLWAHR